MKNLFILFSLVATVAIVAGDYYCEIPCKDEKNNTIQHIACNNNGLFDEKKCPFNAKLLDVKPEDIPVILNKLNDYRNSFAQYYKVCRMATLQYSKELAELASFIVKQCEKNNDKCHHSKGFHFSAARLYLSIEESLVPLSFDNIFGFTYFGWQNSDETDILPQTLEHITHVGCAASNYVVNQQEHFLLACIYGGSDGHNTECDKAAQHCQKEINPEYSNLCSIHESYAD